MLLVPAGNASTWTGPTGNNTYLLPGRIPALIDAGVGHPGHIDAIAAALDEAPLALVLITHAHIDHVAGVPAIRARWPNVEFRQFGSGDRPLSDGEVVPAGDEAIGVVHTPGHSPDHCCFVRDEDVFCGDLLRVGGTVVVPASRGGDMRLYLESLQRVRELRPAKLLPAHGPIIEDAATMIDRYVEHRLSRERQILKAIGSSALTPEEIVARVYDPLPPELTPAASDTVLAHLVKLRSEGRVNEHDGRWTVRP